MKVERTRKRSEGFPPDRKVEKKKEPSVEEKLQKLHSEIKFALKVDNPDVKRCLNALEELGTLQVTSQILQKNTDVVATLKKIRRYKANKEVMEKAAEVYTRLKSRVLGPKIEAIQKATRTGTEKERAEVEKADEALVREEAPTERVEDKTSADLSAPVNGEATSQKGRAQRTRSRRKDRTQRRGQGAAPPKTHYTTTALGRALTWMGPGRSGCGWTRSPWMTRTAELGSLRPGPAPHTGAPRLTQLLRGAQGAENYWGDPVLFVCICSPGVFFSA